MWDNNDANMETLDGKETLHSTVGHTYQNVLQKHKEVNNSNELEYRNGKNRRKFVGNERQISPFRHAIKKAQFSTTLPESSILSATLNCQIQMKMLDFCWFYLSMKDNLPLYAGYMSQQIEDPLPLQRICYMDPISKSPTNNDVVKETMIRTINVAKETGQDYAVATYDLAIALKAYSIQAIEAPLFDKLLIMLGNFHTELAFYGAVGTLINESGVEFILVEADILAEGSMMGFMKGKFYNRCTRIHQLLSNVLEQKLYNRFLLELPEEDLESFQQVMSALPLNEPLTDEQLSNPTMIKHLQLYDRYFQSVLEGQLGPTAQFWTIYIFLISRVHREMQRCVKMNDVSGYMNVFPLVLVAFFALNRPNYARWGSLFLQKLKNMHPKLREILEKGAFSVRRTSKHFSRSAVDLSLEQTVNRDAASSMKGIVAFRNSEHAIRRWSITMTQRAMAVTELRSYAGLEMGENATVQCSPSRIKRDNNQMAVLSSKMDEFCNPFSDDAPSKLVNITTGQAVSDTTQSYLLNMLKRGEEERDKFQNEWDSNQNRFLQPLKRMTVHNFAAQNTKKKVKLPACTKAKANAESLRDMFVRMVIVIAEKTSFNLEKVLCYPITTYPLSLAHCDGSHVKTEKSALLKKLESFQTEYITENEKPVTYAQVYDGGLLLHSILVQTNVGASYASIARNVLSVVCSGAATEVHVCLDKYLENSIKDSERHLRGANDSAYVITGPEQNIRQTGQKLLSNGIFKNELSKFLLKEWSKKHYWHLFGGKRLIASFGGECLQYIPEETHDISVSRPSQYQGNHEEADTLMAFHIKNIRENNIIVRASDTDVLVILIGALGNLQQAAQPRGKILFDCGMGNSRRYINVSNIVSVLEAKHPDLPKALPGFHAFTGCDFTSAFYR